MTNGDISCVFCAQQESVQHVYQDNVAENMNHQSNLTNKNCILGQSFCIRMIRWVWILGNVIIYSDLHGRVSMWFGRWCHGDRNDTGVGALLPKQNGECWWIFAYWWMMHLAARFSCFMQGGLLSLDKNSVTLLYVCGLNRLPPDGTQLPKQV